jgi:DNA-binding Xre family transcriptional regulator
MAEIDNVRVNVFQRAAKKKIPMTELAERSGVTYEAIRQFKKGGKLRFETVEALAEALAALSVS